MVFVWMSLDFNKATMCVTENTALHQYDHCEYKLLVMYPLPSSLLLRLPSFCRRHFGLRAGSVGIGNVSLHAGLTTGACKRKEDTRCGAGSLHFSSLLFSWDVHHSSLPLVPTVGRQLHAKQMWRLTNLARVVSSPWSCWASAPALRRSDITASVGVCASFYC